MLKTLGLYPFGRGRVEFFFEVSFESREAPATKPGEFFDFQVVEVIVQHHGLHINLRFACIRFNFLKLRPLGPGTGNKILYFGQNRKRVPRPEKVVSPLELNTLFISEDKLPIKYHPQGEMAFVSQSGAFFITRYSQALELPVKYGFCIGNQLDISLHHFLDIFDL